MIRNELFLFKQSSHEKLQLQHSFQSNNQVRRTLLSPGELLPALGNHQVGILDSVTSWDLALDFSWRLGFQKAPQQVSVWLVRKKKDPKLVVLTGGTLIEP